MIRETKKTDQEKLLSIIAGSGQFDESGIEYVKATLEEHFDGTSHAIWFTAEENEPVGVAYCIPEPVTSGTWNLLMLWVKNSFKGQGFGTKLVLAVEDAIKAKNARLLIVETSSLDDFIPARSFYEKMGFKKEATIKNFFEVGDDKVIYTKKMAES